VHALVPTVLLGRGGLDEVGQDPEFDPPDREPGEACEGHGSERRSVVGPDLIRESILSEEAPEDGPVGRPGCDRRRLRPPCVARELAR